MVKKVYKNLSNEQRDKGVIFSSCLSEYPYEVENCTVHEVKKINEENYKDKPTYELIKEIDEQKRIIQRLKDDAFFNNSPFKFNIIRK